MCFREASSPEFRSYAEQVVKNASRLAEVLREEGLRICSGGTDNHLVLVDLQNLGITGDIGEAALSRAGIVVNMNMIPFDPKPPRTPSGLRIGTPSVTSRGFNDEEAGQIGHWIARIVKDPENETLTTEIAGEVKTLCGRRPIFPS